MTTAVKETSSSDSYSDKSSDNEDVTPKYGNLRIFDDKTNEAITIQSHQSKQCKRKRTHGSPEQKSDTSLTSGFSNNTYRSGEVPGKTVRRTGVGKKENVLDYGSIGITTSLVSDRTYKERTCDKKNDSREKRVDIRPGQLASEEQKESVDRLEGKRKPHSLRANRVVDLNSVHYVPFIKNPGSSEERNFDRNGNRHIKPHRSRANRVVELKSVQYDPLYTNPGYSRERKVKAQHIAQAPHSGVNRRVAIESAEPDSICCILL